MRKMRVVGACLVRGVVAVLGAAGACAQNWSPADVKWPGNSATGADSVPIGNGRVGANVWTDGPTGDLMLLLSSTDAFDENARLLKLGRVRISWGGATPGPGDQERLVVREGRLEFTLGERTLEVFVDPDHDVIHVRGVRGDAADVRVTVECWRNERREIGGSGSNSERNASWTMHDGGSGGSAGDVRIFETPDRFVALDKGDEAVEWFHRNEESCVPFTLKHQSVDGLPGAFDPLVTRTFGGRVEGAGLVRDGERGLRSQAPAKALDLRIATCVAQTPTPEAWSARVRASSKASRDATRAMARTAVWWGAFWDRSHVETAAGDAPDKQTPEKLGTAYTLQRYVTACQARGENPIKFNGGIFTIEPGFQGEPKHNPDWRRWGDCYWWQNTRHMYHPMFATGDAEMTDSLFGLYERSRVLCESRSKAYYDAQGAYFPETMTLFGAYSNGDYGWNREGLAPGVVLCPWWDDAWNQGPELVALMLDRWDYTRDRTFARQRLVPMARSVLTYFDTRFKKDAAGKIVIDPTQVVETYWDGVVNDTPTVAGLIAVTERLTALPSGVVGSSDRAFFERMRRATPSLPTELQPERETGLTRTRIAPAERYNPRQISNVENGELYAVWPFALVRLGREELMPEALSAWRNKRNDLSVGWGYDGNVAAMLGLVEPSSRIIRAKVNNSKRGYRWPGTWGPNFDWLPDQNHGGNLLTMTNLMLVQGDAIELGGKIRVLPAWPKGWDVNFKLWAPGKTVVECSVKDGKVQSLRVTPRERMKDVVMGEGWR